MPELTFSYSFWAPFLVAAGVAAAVGAVVIRQGAGWGIIDDPKKHKHPKVVHDKAVPRGGGVVIFAAFLAGAVIFLPKTQQTAGVVLGSLMLAITGFLDDKFEEKISPYWRLGINALAAGTVIATGVGISFITNPAGGVFDLGQFQWCMQILGNTRCLWVVADLFALVWLLWMQNIVGWSSGVDGQLPGFVIIAAITMALLGMRFGTDTLQWPVITLAAITAGAYAGFLPWNWFPQKMMPGYGGKSLAGFLLGILAIWSGAKVGAMMIVLGLPFIDAVMVITKRIREGRSPVWGGHEHLHHYLLDMGWSKRKIAILYWATSLALSILALRLKAPSKYFTMATVALIAGGVILWLQNWSIYSKQPAPGNGSKT
ncbi:MAG: hypothetical protein UX86_C0038G0005 [Candidatus Amesbacteria bacterium GW2011_GWC1_47_15]|uniref:Glycosyl transferase family 4 n=1 Tax=Candidatus Amesbacteria bacterium GW2011_GWC1_47_15 TaxID=1618364 RepID=A0A0G1UZ35_9BACT|nr:MAG: hypothetical protein UX86_C0038G0005 [Candidatus Amesbacteria bacterium GW2011_GWC1_47_15]